MEVYNISWVSISKGIHNQDEEEVQRGLDTIIKDQTQAIARTHAICFFISEITNGEVHYVSHCSVDDAIKYILNNPREIRIIAALKRTLFPVELTVLVVTYLSHLDKRAFAEWLIYDVLFKPELVKYYDSIVQYLSEERISECKELLISQNRKVLF